MAYTQPNLILFQRYSSSHRPPSAARRRYEPAHTTGVVFRASLEDEGGKSPLHFTHRIDIDDEFRSFDMRTCLRVDDGEPATDSPVCLPQVSDDVDRAGEAYDRPGGFEGARGVLVLVGE
jgi:hypothetical protein